ncbi:CAP-Gly domain-containing linker protein 4 [Trichonephila inaurata madagascariensis]|uniref:CAP-Gly domain-containing linker protein 4 n=1 Tax=Trichonephila inaurata madagascariensis TaxID=2747483 RepID=A0A8X6XEK0_9ARAC|nr:CAP-Gly domain-containing linker protein 4 [Trichonephila inaurata madagascariensis]
MTATQDLAPNKAVENVKPVETRRQPIIHPSSDAPQCKNCHLLDLPFFDPSCCGCMEILQNTGTSIPQIFAIIRQWMPRTQQKIEMLVNEVLIRGANVNDRDGLTDMTLLHYACKAGANGVGNVTTATRTVGLLLDKGADIHLRCRWTDMAAIHYAAYFDVAPVIELLLKASKGLDINSPCREFEGGSPLHIAATNLCTEAAKLLLEHNADVTLKDFSGRTPLECIPDFPSTQHTPDLREVIGSLRQLLEAATPKHLVQEQPQYGSIGGKAVLKAIGVQIGDKVLVGGAKVGILRYCGGTQFAQGIWAGVELEEPLGKNDGTLKGVTYFKCSQNHGIFAPINKISKYDSNQSRNRSPCASRCSPPRSISFSKVNVSHVTSKIETGLSSLRRQNSDDFAIGDRVLVSGHRKGTIRFAGETEFSSGFWYGIELEKPLGKNDGSVNNVQYFTCSPGYGLFAPPHRICKLFKNSEDDCSDHDSADLSLMSKSSTEGENGILSPSSPRSTLNSQRSIRKSSRFSHQLSSPLNSQKNCWLTVGINVFVNNEIGVVRYMGPVDFADGTWLGIELRTPKGKNDGTVQGKSYFSCRPSYGLLVRPNRVTVRGINGAKLLDESYS